MPFESFNIHYTYYVHCSIVHKCRSNLETKRAIRYLSVFLLQNNVDVVFFMLRINSFNRHRASSTSFYPNSIKIKKNYIIIIPKTIHFEQAKLVEENPVLCVVRWSDWVRLRVLYSPLQPHLFYVGYSSMYSVLRFSSDSLPLVTWAPCKSIVFGKKLKYSFDVPSCIF